MKTFSCQKRNIFANFFLVKLLFILAIFFFVFGVSACRKSVDYGEYLSELRANVFLANHEDFSLRIYAVRKENPYKADGIPCESTHRTEVYLVAPSGDETCNLSFHAGEKDYGGEMSYDSVRAEYYFSCTLDLSEYSRVDCKISFGEKDITLSAISVRNENTLSPKSVLAKLVKSEKTLFQSMTDKYGFSGEIHLRLIYEDAPFYYVGVIDRNGKINAFLINAQTGKILAKRSSDT